MEDACTADFRPQPPRSLAMRWKKSPASHIFEDWVGVSVGSFLDLKTAHAHANRSFANYRLEVRWEGRALLQPWVWYWIPHHHSHRQHPGPHI